MDTNISDLTDAGDWPPDGLDYSATTAINQVTVVPRA
jgi:hypothetical protein